MRKPKLSTPIGDILKLDQALLASIKGIRTLAERAQGEAESAEDKARLRKIIERKIGGTQHQPKKGKTVSIHPRVRRMERALALLTDSQYQIVLGLAKSMTRHAKSNPKTDPKPDSQGPT